MRSHRFAFAVALITISTYGMLYGDMPAVGTGQWRLAGSLAGARGGSAAALLPEGGVLVTGGASADGSAASVELFGVNGSFSAVAPMETARADHAAVTLRDGRVLVIGGRNADGAVASAEIFDEGVWSAAGTLAEARWNLTATLLEDGRVLVAGGENGTGPIAGLELFDPETGSFSAAGTLSAPRTGHAAAKLADGRVIIAGGFNGETVLNSIDVYDPATSSIAAGPALASPRAGLSATTLLDGTVLLVGGNDGTNDLGSAEVFSPSTGMIAPAAPAATPRRDHQAFLLPNNGTVLIVGGVSGQGTSAAELYVPWANEFQPTGAMNVARANATGTALLQDGLLIVAGGDGLASAEVYGFATVKTDKPDYAPGEIVTMSGTGWQPGETVRLVLGESPSVHEARVFEATADEAGRIVNTEFSPEPHDIGVRFYLTAIGAGSQARTTFTDGNVRFAVSDLGASFTGSYQKYASGNCNGAVIGTGGAPLTPNPGGTLTVAAVAGESVLITANAIVNTWTFVNWTGPAGFSSTNPTLCAPGGNGTDIYVAHYVQNTATTLTVSAASGVYNGTTTLSATLTGTGGVGVSGKPVTFALNGSPAGSATTDASGVATVSGVSLGTINAGTYTGGVAAAFAGDTSHAASNGSNTLTVTKATPTITWDTPADIVYGTLLGASQLSASADVAGGFVYTPVAGTKLNAGNGQTLAVDFTPSDTTNYNTASKSVTINVAPLAASVTPNAATKVYGDADPALTGSLVGFIAADSVTATYTRAAGETVLGGPYTISATLSPNGVLSNYDITYNTANFTITPKAASVTPNDKAKVFGTPDPTLDGLLSGFLAADGVVATYSREAGENVADSPYTISATLSPAGVLTNYSIAYNTALFTITKAPQTIVFTSTPPNPFSLGSTYTVAASGGGSLNAVVFTTLTPAICSLAGNQVTASTIGLCRIAANQAGSDNYDPAPQTVQEFGTHYAFTGFFSPVDNLPMINAAKAGSAIPVKFSLHGNQGLNILESGYPTSQPIACDSTAGDDIEEVLTATNSGLNYDAIADQYIYVWKTDKSWSGCRLLTVKLKDGTVHQAKFKFGR